MQSASPALLSRMASLNEPAVPALQNMLFDLYSCPTEPERWSSMLDQLCALTGARSAVIQHLSLEGARLIPRWSAQDSHTRNYVAPRCQYLASDKNPRLKVRQGALSLNRLVRDEDIFLGDEAALNELRQQLGAAGLGRFIGRLWQIGENSYATIALHRASVDGGDFSSNQIEKLGEFSPHLQQALQLSIRLQAANGLEVQLRRQFDHLHCGMVVCDAGGRVRWLNSSAERLLSGGHALRLRVDTLFGRRAQDTDRLLEAVGAVSRAGSKGRYLALGGAPGVLHLALQPLADLGLGDSDNSVLMIVTTPENGMPVSVEALGALFGLTPAESNLVCALVGGLSLDQYAARRQVSLGTVRGQLKQALAKTGASRQSELVRLVLSSAAAQIRPVG